MLHRILHLNLPYIVFWLPALVGGAAMLLVAYFWRAGRKPAAVAAAAPPEVPIGVTDFSTITTGSTEHRRSFRRGGNPIVVKYATPDSKETASEGWVVDRSMGGFCLMTLEEIKPDTVLSVLPTKTIEMIPWIDVHVRSCRKGDDCYELGCQWVKPPPYSIMLLFG
jgi:hypothetical protein